eukprot:scaffold250_cov110-Isochrysis_galbana.AAC.4
MWPWLRLVGAGSEPERPHSPAALALAAAARALGFRGFGCARRLKLLLPTGQQKTKGYEYTRFQFQVSISPCGAQKAAQSPNLTSKVFADVPVATESLLLLLNARLCWLADTQRARPSQAGSYRELREKDTSTSQRAMLRRRRCVSAKVERRILHRISPTLASYVAQTGRAGQSVLCGCAATNIANLSTARSSLA